MSHPETTTTSALKALYAKAVVDTSLATRVAWSIVAVITLSVLTTSLLTVEPMVGDEVTHFYMLKHQAEVLPTPNFRAYIETAFGDDAELRGYPHAFFWHYAGAIVYRLTGGSMLALHVFHWLFLVQLLVATLFLVWPKERRCDVSEVLALALVVSLPMTLLFSVTFYLDVPASAQVVTAFACLRYRKWGWGAICMALAVGIKESMLVMAPSYMLYLVFCMWGQRWRHIILAALAGISCLALVCGITAWSLWHYERTTYYPTDMLRVVINRALDVLPAAPAAPGADSATDLEEPDRRLSMYDDGVIANHPSDLRVAINWVIFGGGLLYAGVLLALMILIWSLFRRQRMDRHGVMQMVAGVLYMVLSAYFLRESPAARFFMPGLYLVMAATVGLCRPLLGHRWVYSIVLAVVVIQSAGVLYKTYTLRSVPSGISAAIQFLDENPPEPNRVFMYPEGNYRLFPCPHDWYLGYHLRDFWSGNNDERIALLHKRKVGAVVVKTHLVGEIDADMNNLGVYPTSFVQDIEADPRFTKVFENNAVRIFSVPTGESQSTPLTSPELPEDVP
jgi:hypothetical protein